MKIGKREYFLRTFLVKSAPYRSLSKGYSNNVWVEFGVETYYFRKLYYFGIWRLSLVLVSQNNGAIMEFKSIQGAKRRNALPENKNVVPFRSSKGPTLF